MADTDGYLPSFFFPQQQGPMTAAQLDARRKIAMALATRNRPYPKTIGEGLTALGEGLGEGFLNSKIASAEQQQQAVDRSLMSGPQAQAEVPAGPASSTVAPAPAPVVPRVTPRPATSASAEDVMPDAENGPPYQVASLGNDVPAPTAPSPAREGVVKSMVAQAPPNAFDQPAVQSDALPLSPPVGYGNYQTFSAPRPSMLPTGERVVQPMKTDEQGQIVIPPDKPYPDPGPEPTRDSVATPQQRAALKHWDMAMKNPYASAAAVEIFKQRYGEVHKEVTDRLAQEWGLWKAEKLKQAEYNLKENERKAELEQKIVNTVKSRREIEGEGLTPMSPEDIKRSFPAGLPPGVGVYLTRKGEPKFVTGPQTVSIDQKQEGAFASKIGGELGQHFVDAYKTGIDAEGDLNTITELRQQAAKIGTGAPAVMQQMLGNLGIKTEGLDQVQQFAALINRLTPQQRVPGTGATSDFDAKMFRDSLPRLMNTPEGNELILNTMERMARNKMQRAEIAGQVVSGQITPQQGVQRMLELQREAKSHSDAVKSALGDQKSSAGAQPDGTIETNQRGERRIWRNGKPEPYGG